MEASVLPCFGTVAGNAAVGAWPARPSAAGDVADVVAELTCGSCGDGAAASMETDNAPRQDGDSTTAAFPECSLRSGASIPCLSDCWGTGDTASMLCAVSISVRGCNCLYYASGCGWRCS